MKIAITKDDIRDIISVVVSDLSKDVSHQSHDVRDYEGVDENDIDEMTDSAWSDLVEDYVI